MRIAIVFSGLPRSVILARNDKDIFSLVLFLNIFILNLKNIRHHAMKIIILSDHIGDKLQEFSDGRGGAKTYQDAVRKCFSVLLLQRKSHHTIIVS